MGYCTQWGVVLGIVVLVGNSWALFLSGEIMYPVGSCPSGGCPRDCGPGG